MASSSSRRGKKAAHLLRNASPNGWISDEEERYNLDVIENSSRWSLTKMTGDYSPDLVQVFYHNLMVVDGVICSRVKGVDIKIDDEIWLSFTGLKEEGFMSHERNAKLNQWTNKKKLYKEYLRSPTRLKKSDEDNALITPSASESDDEDNTTEVESMETSDSD
ncbi:hypothetical protein LR48_Vigan10g173800 [Vigna angularis]|uniref:Uncharacterized protein n=1 Tax=Phaseolus angularis TaxID=3914 RepID=A0A0L9VLA3_PHAAN|nr:hypothetical protein LR48_Vigan10g173800 [Vigna angularis]